MALSKGVLGSVSPVSTPCSSSDNSPSVYIIFILPVQRLGVNIKIRWSSVVSRQSWSIPALAVVSACKEDTYKAVWEWDKTKLRGCVVRLVSGSRDFGDLSWHDRAGRDRPCHTGNLIINKVGMRTWICLWRWCHTGNLIIYRIADGEAPVRRDTGGVGSTQ